MSEILLTILTSPKPFTDPHINTIQRNAIQSWINLGENVEVFLIGNDDGVDTVAADFRIRHFPHVLTNEKRTPLISSMLQIGRENSSSPFLALVNTDILLFPDLVNAVNVIKTSFKEFLLVGQRWDIDIDHLVQNEKDFYPRLQKMIKSKGTIHPPMGSDYFLFPRSCFPKIPDFAIGRAGWDNWMIYKARFEHWSVIDGTKDILIAHQNHDYRHFKDGKPHYKQPETKENVKLAGGDHTIFTLADSQYELENGKITRTRLTWSRIKRQLEILPMILLKSNFLGKLFFYLFHPKKAYSRIKKRN